MILLTASLALARIQSLINADPTDVDTLLDAVGNHPKLILAGAGKSFLVAQLASKMANSYGLKWACLDTASAGHGDAGSLAKTDLILLLSGTGETEETNRFAVWMHEMTLAALTTRSDSSLSRLVNLTIVLPLLSEGSLYGRAPMCSSIVFIAFLFEVINRVAEDRCSEEQYLSAHPAGGIGGGVHSA